MSFLDDATKAANYACYFNTTEYLEAKAAQLNSWAVDGKTDWSAADVANAFAAAGLTAEQHYVLYGSKETDAAGNLINPSNAFDVNAYMSALLKALSQQDPAAWAGKTAADIAQGIADSGLTPITHYAAEGAALAAATGVSLAQTVPVAQRVDNDDARAVYVPSNYNKPVQAPSNVTADTASAVAKPCDMGSLLPLVNYDLDLIATPGAEVLTPYDDGYVPVPDGGILDTNENPVVLVQQTVTDSAGNVVASIAEYGVRSVVNGTVVVRPVDTNGNVLTDATPIQVISDAGTSTVLHTEDGEDIVQTIRVDGETAYTDTSGNAVEDPAEKKWPDIDDDDDDDDDDHDDDHDDDDDDHHGGNDDHGGGSGGGGGGSQQPASVREEFNESEGSHTGSIHLTGNPASIAVGFNNSAEVFIFENGGLTERATRGLEGTTGTMTFTEYSGGTLKYTYPIKNDINVPNTLTYEELFTIYNRDATGNTLSTIPVTMAVNDSVPVITNIDSNNTPCYTTLCATSDSSTGIPFGTIDYGADRPGENDTPVFTVTVLDDHGKVVKDSSGNALSGSVRVEQDSINNINIDKLYFIQSSNWEDGKEYTVNIQATDSDNTPSKIAEYNKIKAQSLFEVTTDGVLQLTSDAKKSQFHQLLDYTMTYTSDYTFKVTHKDSATFEEFANEGVTKISAKGIATPLNITTQDDVEVGLGLTGRRAIGTSFTDTYLNIEANNANITLGTGRDLISLSYLSDDATNKGFTITTDGTIVSSPDVIQNFGSKDKLVLLGAGFTTGTYGSTSTSWPITITQGDVDVATGSFTTPTTGTGNDYLLQWGSSGTAASSLILDNPIVNITGVNIVTNATGDSTLTFA